MTPPTPLAILLGFPAALYFAAAALPVAAAFFYRRRARVVNVPAVALWQQLGRPVEVRSFAALLRRLLSLSAQLAVLALLVFALADPWPGGRVAGRKVIVLDVSATMQTREPGGGDRFALAKERALADLATLNADAEAAVVLAGRTPSLAQPMTRDLTAVRRAIQDARAQDVDGDLSAALRTAAALSDPAVPCEVIVCSDFAAEEASTLRTGWLSPARLTLAAVGTDQPDVAVTDIWADARAVSPDAADAAAASPTRARVTATLAQRGLAGRPVPVTAEVDGRVVATREVTLGDGPTPVAFDVAASAGAAIKVQVEAGDALRADDAGYAVLAAPQRWGVCLVTAGNAALQRALRADPSVALRVVAPDAFKGTDGAAVVIFDGPRPAIRAAGDDVAGYLFIGTADPFGWAEGQGWADVGPVTHWAGDHPTMADLDPTGLRIPKALRLQWRSPGAAQDVLSADATPLVAALTPPPAAPGGRSPRCVYWLFDPKSGELTRQAGFPLMLWNTVDYLLGRQSNEPGVPNLAGRPLRVPDAAGITVTGPDDDARPTKPDTARPAGSDAAPAAIVYDTARQGIYAVDRGGGRREAYAVNLLSSRGTRPPGGLAGEGLGDGASQAAIAPAAWWRVPFARPGWDSILLAAVACLLVEWLLFHRRAVRVE